MIRLFVLLSLCLFQIAAYAAPLDLNEWNDGPIERQALASFKAEAGRAGVPELRLHYSGELGKPAQSLEKMMSGELDLVSGGLENFLPLIIDEVTGLTLPFLLPDTASTEAYLASPLLDEGREKVLHSRQIRFLTMTELRQPSRLILATKPIHAVQDLKGLTVLVLPAPTNAAVRVWRQLGVTLAPPLAAGDLPVLVPGRLDAVVLSGLEAVPDHNPPSGLRYAGEIHDRPDLWTIAIREEIWKRLSPARQAELSAAAAKAGGIVTKKSAEARDALLRKLRSDGVEIGAVDSVAIHQALEPFYASLIEYGDINPRVLQAAQAALGRPTPAP